MQLGSVVSMDAHAPSFLGCEDPVRHTHTADSIQSIIFVMFVISVTELLPQHKLQKTIAWLVHLGVRAISCSGERPGA
ncbi:hypothetical protein V2G26_009664 [Clonostachys chloroleuca]